jgi:hypothetical protein
MPWPPSDVASMSSQDPPDSLAARIARLQFLVAAARAERERLETAVADAVRRQIAVPRDTLALLESLAEVDALADSDRLAEVAAQLPPPADVAGDLFARDEPSLAIGTLAAQGQSAAEISRRLGLPLGEVELLLSARAAS